MATKTFIVTVPAGIGGGFYIDGVQKPTLDLAVGAIYRFDQSDSTNAFHPLNFSATSDGTHGGGTKYTTNVTEVGTPGSSGAYTEITLSSSTPNPLYYYCQNHSGMGGQLDLNSNSWGALSWSEGNWGDQTDVTTSITGLSNSIALNSVDSFPNQGWGSDFWGSENWGESTIDVQLTGLGLTVDSGAKENWGELGWNSANTEWGGPYIPTVAIGQQVDILGEQLNIQDLGDPFVFSATEVFLDQNPLTGLTIEEGQVGDRTDVFPQGIQLNTNLGTVTAFNEQGWGRDDWGTEVWGAQGIWVTATLDNTNLGLGVTSGVRETWGQDEWGATTTEWGGSSVTDVGILTNAAVTGIELTAEEGIVDPSPDATVLGIGLTAGVALGSVIEADANVTITGIGLEIDQGQAELDAVTIASITGQQLNTSLNSAVAGASAEIFPTGNELTITSGSINVQSWQIVDTGTNVNWNIIDTAA
jgi:hypothetical protein